MHRANHDGGVQLKCLSDRRRMQQDLKSSIETGGDGIDLSQDVALEHEGGRSSLIHTVLAPSPSAKGLALICDSALNLSVGAGEFQLTVSERVSVAPAHSSSKHHNQSSKPSEPHLCLWRRHFRCTANSCSLSRSPCPEHWQCLIVRSERYPSYFFTKLKAHPSQFPPVSH